MRLPPRANVGIDPLFEEVLVVPLRPVPRVGRKAAGELPRVRLDRLDRRNQPRRIRFSRDDPLRHAHLVRFVDGQLGVVALAKAEAPVINREPWCG